MIQRDTKKIVDDKKKLKRRTLRDFDKLMDHMTEQYMHRAIFFDPREAKRERQR